MPYDRPYVARELKIPIMNFGFKMLPELIIKIDYDSPIVPGLFKLHKPTVYKAINGYCCLLGANPEVGTFACGMTLQEAMNAWVNEYIRNL